MARVPASGRSLSPATITARLLARASELLALTRAYRYAEPRLRSTEKELVLQLDSLAHLLCQK